MKFFVTALALVAVVAVGSSPAAAEDCVDVELSVERFVPPVPVYHFDFFLSVINCGSAPSIVSCLITLEANGVPVGSAEISAPMEAGEEFRIDHRIPINPNIPIPVGTCRLCIVATSGTATDTSCATVVIDEAGNVLSFTLEGENTPVQALTWSAIKSLFR